MPRRVKNPISPMEKWLLIGGAVTLGGVLFYYWTAQPSALPGSVVNGEPLSVTLSVGTMAGVTLSLATQNDVSIVAPTGATLGNANVVGNLQNSPSGANYDYIANAVGSGTVTVTWTDSTGASQTSTLPVTITA